MYKNKKNHKEAVVNWSDTCFGITCNDNREAAKI